ncbi:thiol-disulfide isomerase/thioredoxin [Nonlabens dokdonensis]|jgi:thiol-disulfide isomerase/thioredoxin|uniref:Thiol-disulfide isomerase/thioredoxin n=2 Tax=Nonlabens dokdonensis TaxID=328515 RepID=A0ABX5PWT8_9FLAO|nr:TlpA disulfide reductase family protein [Nonlabens dokdonensis]AGC78572.1 putative thiol:disulfide interchange protein [Nonlabens dokdonensis DSW-6]PZX39297.1 thiol-disulfide isomerase/thioredoxin [Nonlabens dokdonensis]
MKKLILIKLILSTVILSGQNTTEIRGFIKNIDIDTLIIAKAFQDFRYNGIEIPVQKEELFKYVLKHKYIEEYSIVYKSDLKKGAWRPIIFYPNSKTIEFEIYPTSEYHKNKIIGDDLGERKIKYQLQFGQKFSNIGNEIYGRIFQLKKGTDSYNEAKSRLDSLNREAILFQHNYFLNDESILGLNEYVYLLKNANQMMISPEILKEYQGFYLKKEYDHPLIERAINLYANLSDEIEVGKLFVDVTLIDQESNSTKLSELLKEDKFIILDLWSPWCGPCIRKSKLLKQNYSIIKRNAKIIGVIGGINEIEKAENAINRLDYPWKNFIEVSDKNQIWEKYGIANSGGAQFLINNEGKILAINPKLEQLLKIINEK